MASILEQVVQAAEDIKAIRDGLVVDVNSTAAIVTGPASGAGAITTLASGVLVAKGTGTAVGDLVEGGGLAAADDGDVTQTVAQSAAKTVSAAGFNNRYGRSWGTNKKISRVRIWTPSDGTLLGANAAGARFRIERSSDGVAFTTVYETPAARTEANGAPIDIAFGIDQNAADTRHYVNVEGDGVNAAAIAEVDWFEADTIEVKSLAKVLLDAEASLLSQFPAPLTVVLDFDAATGAGPAAGTFRLGSAVQAQSVVLRASKTDVYAASAVGRLAVAALSTNPNKGVVAIVKHGDRTKYLVTRYTAAAVNANDVDFAVAPPDPDGEFSAASPFAAGDRCLLVFLPIGDKGNPGQDGAGSGDVQSDDDPTVVDQLLAFSTTTKHVVGRALAAVLAGKKIDGNNQQVLGPWSNVATAATVDLGATNTVLVNLTGSTGITSFGSRDGWWRIVQAQDGVTVTRDAINLETPNGQNITLAAGDKMLVVSDQSRAAAKVEVIAVFRKDGRAFRGPSNIPEAIAFTGIVTPAQITANQNNYSPSGLSTASVLRLASDATRTVTGIAGGDAGRVLVIENVGANAIVLSDADASSSAANRFDFGRNVTLGAKNAAALKYDAGDSRWKLVSLSISFGALAVLDRVTNIDQNLALSGDITPAQITANQNDYSPSGLSTASVLRLASDASRNLTGLAGGADGRLVGIVNVGNNALVLKNDDASSSAGNRFAIGADITLPGGYGALLWYDATASRWRALSVYVQPAAGGSGTTVHGVCDGRLSPATGTFEPPAAAVSAATSVYFVPGTGNQIGLYDGAAWQVVAFSEKSLKLTDTQSCTTTDTSTNLVVADSSQLVVGMEVSGTGIQGGTTIAAIVNDTNVTLSLAANASGTNNITFKVPANKGVDIYGKLVAGALKLFMILRSAVHTPTANGYQDGVEVKNGDATLRWLGAVKTGATAGQWNYALAGEHRYSLVNRYNKRAVRHCESFASNGTWYKPLGLIKLKSDVAGGSGAGGNFATNGSGAASPGGHGGNGGRSLKSIAAAALGATEAVTVGAAAGTSSFGSHHSATGGGAGQNASTVGATTAGAHGSHGTASGGDVNLTGGGPAGGPGGGIRINIPGSDGAGGQNGQAGAAGWVIVDELLEV